MSILILEILNILLIVLFSLHVIYNYSNTSKAISYLLLINFLPIAGMVAYLLLGLNRRKHKMYNRKLIEDQAIEKRVQDFVDSINQSVFRTRTEDIGKQVNLARLLAHDSYTPLTPYNRVEILNNGEATYPEIIRCLKRAKKHIHIEYYIIENGSVWKEIMGILIEKAKAGVEVRIIYDDFGSQDVRKAYKKELEKVGVEIYPFLKLYFVLLANRINYRNHRKILIIDGMIAFTGGINISDRYINHPGDKKVYWRDTHLKLEGYAVYSLQNIFLGDWNFCSNQWIVPNDDLFPEIPKEYRKENILVQIASSGPDSTYPTIMYAMISAITASQSEILIATPYFIPSGSLLNALRIAALCGVKIKLLVPDRSDSRLVNAASSSYYEDLLEYGIEIYRYQKGFVHSKLMICDREMAMLGSANMDIRSFNLNFEVNTQIYNGELARQLAQQFDQDLADAKRIDPREWADRPVYVKMVEKVFRLASSLL